MAQTMIAIQASETRKEEYMVALILRDDEDESPNVSLIVIAPRYFRGCVWVDAPKPELHALFGIRAYYELLQRMINDRSYKIYFHADSRNLESTIPIEHQLDAISVVFVMTKENGRDTIRDELVIYVPNQYELRAQDDCTQRAVVQQKPITEINHAPEQTMTTNARVHVSSIEQCGADIPQLVDLQTTSRIITDTERLFGRIAQPQFDLACKYLRIKSHIYDFCARNPTHNLHQEMINDHMLTVASTSWGCSSEFAPRDIPMHPLYVASITRFVNLKYTCAHLIEHMYCRRLIVTYDRNGANEYFDTTIPEYRRDDVAQYQANAIDRMHQNYHSQSSFCYISRLPSMLREIIFAAPPEYDDSHHLASIINHMITHCDLTNVQILADMNLCGLIHTSPTITQPRSSDSASSIPPRQIEYVSVLGIRNISQEYMCPTLLRECSMMKQGRESREDHDVSKLIVDTFDQWYGL